MSTEKFPHLDILNDLQAKGITQDKMPKDLKLMISNWNASHVRYKTKPSDAQRDFLTRRSVEIGDDLLTFAEQDDPDDEPITNPTPMNDPNNPPAPPADPKVVEPVPPAPPAPPEPPKGDNDPPPPPAPPAPPAPVEKKKWDGADVLTGDYD